MEIKHKTLCVNYQYLSSIIYTKDVLAHINGCFKSNAKYGVINDMCDKLFFFNI